MDIVDAKGGNMLKNIELKSRNGWLYFNRRSLKLRDTKENREYALRYLRDKYHMQHTKTFEFFASIVLREACTQSTLKLARKAFELLDKTLGNKSIGEYTVLEIDELIEWMLKVKKYSPATIKLYLSQISRAFNEAERLDYIGKNPARYAKLPRKKKVEKKTYTKEELKALTDGAEGDLKIFLYLAIHTGARANEIITSNWKNIDFERNKILIHSSKTKNSYYVPIMKPLRELLECIEDKNGRVLSRNYNQLVYDFKELCESTGVRYLGTHAFRHTFISLMIQAGENPALVAKFVGHKSLQMINETYAHYIEKENDMSEFEDLMGLA